MLESKHFFFFYKKYIKIPLNLYILSIKLYLDIMDDINKSSFYLLLHYPDSTSKSVRRLLKIWETSAL